MLGPSFGFYGLDLPPSMGLEIERINKGTLQIKQNQTFETLELPFYRMLSKNSIFSILQ